MSNKFIERWNTFMRKIANPKGIFYTCFMVVMVLITIYNTLVIPFRAVFYIGQQRDDAIVIDTVLDLVLLVDIFLNFYVPYHKEGITYDDLKDIRRNYLRGWFTIDVLASLPIEIAYLTPINVLHKNPVFRFNKLLRFAKLGKTFEHFAKYTNVKTALLRLIKFLIYVAMITHWIACGYFLIIYIEGSYENHWAVTPNLLALPIHTQYSQSLYWAIVSMTSYGDTDPATDLEHIYGMITLGVGTVMFVAVIGTVGTLVRNLDSNAYSFREKMDSVNDYMRYRKIPTHLQKQVRNYYTYLWKSRKGLDESKVLADLPGYLHGEVSYSINREIIEKIPLFKGVDRSFISALLPHLKPSVVMPGMKIVRKGEIGRELFIISRGSVEITSEDGSIVFATLEDGSFFGEVALLNNSRRTATVRAKTHCDLFVLEKKDFDDVLSEHPEQALIIREAAAERQRLLQEAQAKAKAPTAAATTTRQPSSSTSE